MRLFRFAVLVIFLLNLALAFAGTCTDGDGVPDFQDNCVNDGNADQKDTDHDHDGDTCDAAPPPPGGDTTGTGGTSEDTGGGTSGDTGGTTTGDPPPANSKAGGCSLIPIPRKTLAPGGTSR